MFQTMTSQRNWIFLRQLGPDLVGKTG
jgi:hypothetical protein